MDSEVKTFWRVDYWFIFQDLILLVDYWTMFWNRDAFNLELLNNEDICQINEEWNFHGLILDCYFTDNH